MRRFPLSAEDLHTIAEALEGIEFLSVLSTNPVFGKIEAIRPDSDDIIGYFVREGAVDDDPWYGLELFSPFGNLHG